ncbi:MAG: CocE/NonD family hydrolase [Candidatus Binatia bacterium]
MTFVQQQGRTDYPVRVVRNIEIPMTDGVRLGAALYMPDTLNDGPFPAIVEYHPYRKDDNKIPRDWRTHSYLARKGYVGVRIDVRGTGASEGIAENEYSEQEQHDCLQALAWLADQSWCTGKLGMYGSSYGGITALQTAMHAPPHLKAVVAMHALVDRYCDDVHYHGGCLPVNESVAWAGRMVALNALPPLPEIVGERWRALWQERLERTPQWPIVWLLHQTRDAYWRRGSPRDNWNAIRCPVFAIGGWADSYHDFVLHLLQHLRGPRKGLIGPWLHDIPHVASPGPQIDHLREMLRWWDYWLKGIETGVMDEPMLTIWVQESRPPEPYLETIPGRWRYETEWPVARTQSQAWYLGDAGQFTSEPPVEAAPDSWNGPLTVGLTAPFWCTGFRPSGLPRDQRPDDAYALTFTSAPLAEPLEILGFPKVQLCVAASEPIAQLAVKLCDVAPDGASLLVTRGVLNLTHRDSHERPAALIPGKIYAVTLELSSVSHVFAAGHRARLSLAGADWPFVWPSPRQATLSLYHDRGHPSHLVLPVIPPREPVLPTPVFAPPEVPDAPIRSEGGPKEYSIQRDMVDGTTMIRTRAASRTYLTEHALSMSENNEKDLSIRAGEPLSCMAEMRRRLEWTRTNWRIEIDSRLRVSCTEGTFIVEIELRARHNGDPLFARCWREEIPRILG